MEKIISSTELQKHTRDLIDLARTQNAVIVIETYGKPMAVMLSYNEYQEYLVYKQNQQHERRERFAQLRLLAEQNANSNEMTDQQAAALIEEVRSEVYRSGIDLPKE